jgi:hypothetical protein
MAHRLASLALLAMLALVPATVRAQSSPLSPELLDKMLDLMPSEGSDKDIPAPAENGLGISGTGQAWETHHFPASAPEDPSAPTHFFSINRGTDEDISFLRRIPDGLYVFQTHRDGGLVMALFWDFRFKQITRLDPAKAQADLNSELAFWTSNIDKFIAEKK